MSTVPVVHQIQKYKEVAAMVAAVKPRVTGGIDARYWRGVERMAIARLEGHGNQCHNTSCANSSPIPRLMTGLFVFALKRARVALRQLILSLSPRHHLHGRLRLPSWRFPQAQGWCCGWGYRQEVRRSRQSLLPQYLRSSGRRSQSRNLNLTT